MILQTPETVLDWAEVQRFALFGGALITSCIFVFTQINSIKSLVFDKFNDLKSVIETKLEYHERHDDQRFESIRKDVQIVQIQIAAKTGKSPYGKTQEDQS